MICFVFRVRLMDNITPITNYPKDYECQVCDTLMLEPIILPDCGHTFCKTCISRVQQNPTTSHCPLCKKPIWSSTQLKTNFTLKKLVEKIEVKCTACNERGSIEVVARHTCPDALVSCSNRGCQRSIKRKDEPTHKEECLYAVISCEQCHQNTTVANKELHLEKTCIRGEIRCPLKCRKRPRRMELQTHLLVCEERQRQCRVNGCQFAGNFKEMEQHNKDQAEKHVSLLTEMGEKLLDVLLKKDTNDLTKTKMALGGFCWSIFNFKQMAADMLQAGNTAEPMASGVYEFEECSWRMLLYVRRTKCKLFLQLHRAVHPVRASFRIVIGLANPVVIELEPDLRLREGETFGTEVALAKLEREAEKNSGWLFMEIFIERFSFSL